MGRQRPRPIDVEVPRPHGPSYSARKGVGPGAGSLAPDDAKRRVFAVLDRFRNLGYFAEAEGTECPDGDEVGLFGADPDDYFAFAIDRTGVWPYRENDGSYDGLDVLCDVLEVLHKVVSRPVEASFHDYGGCGDHYVAFDREEGQLAFRDCINAVLERCSPPLKLDATGLIVERGDPGLEDLIGQTLPASTPPSVEARVASAIRVFRDRHSDVAALRHGVLDLAAALEEIRPLVKQEMLKKDEQAIFELANGFEIRHAGRAQRGDYDKTVWLRWAFYVYTATLHAVLAVVERQDSSSETPVLVVDDDIPF